MKEYVVLKLPRLNIFKIRIKQKWSIFDLIVTRFMESGGEIKNFVFLKNVNICEGKNNIAFLILHEATCMQK